MKQLATIWANTITPQNVYEKHPRPQFMRQAFINLNGLWDYAIEKINARPSQEKFPPQRDGQILVPFSPETALSGVGCQLMPDEYLWYRRTIHYEKTDRRLLLHFDAVDQSCVLYINGLSAASHTGGYLPFCVDASEFLRPGTNEIVLRVRDESDESYHSRGKQKLKKGGMFYTAQSGIWQSVWAEYVPEDYITKLELVPMTSPDRIQIIAVTDKKAGCLINITLYAPRLYTNSSDEPEDLTQPCGEVLEEYRETSDTLFSIPIEDAKYWTPEEPYLYYMDIECKGGDKIRTYFALRSFTLEYINGEEFPRVCLNGRPYFQNGVLDQGYWPESLMTPPCDEAIIWDLTEMKQTGYNMVRKHIKIEADRWYYHCDRLGLIVWQDMVNGGGPLHQWFVTYAATPLSIKRIRVSDKMHYLLSRTSKEGQLEFKNEMVATIRLLKNHPSICTWVIFNEGWGQFSTARMTLLAKKTDPTRLIDQASGWFDQRGGDFFSVHNYFFELTVTPEKKRANVLSEIGGIVYNVEGHSQNENTYGYAIAKDRKDLNSSYSKLMEKVRTLMPKGLCGCVYTQWTDIEGEINGVYTYDRKVRKIDGEKISF